MSRKRIRSSECPYYQQTKQFISQHIADQHNPKKMNEIHKKTVNLLFKGINNHFNSNNNGPELLMNKKDFYRMIQFHGNGEYSIIGQIDGNNKMQPNCWLPDKPDRSCLGCSKQSRLHTHCTCCNLELCEQCGISCGGECIEPLCMNCVNLFECGTMDNPICNRCKYYQF